MSQLFSDTFLIPPFCLQRTHINLTLIKVLYLEERGIYFVDEYISLSLSLFGLHYSLIFMHYISRV